MARSGQSETMSAKAIEALDADPDYRYSSIWGSLNGMFGDFGRYEIEPALDTSATPTTRSFAPSSSESSSPAS